MFPYYSSGLAHALPCTLTRMSRIDLIGGCKKRRNRGERPVFRFNDFGMSGHPIEFNGLFRDNIKSLLECGNSENHSCSQMASKSFQLQVHPHAPLHVSLFVIEESSEASLPRYCKHCQYIGWGHHMICKKKYHFLVTSKHTEAAACLRCQGDDDIHCGGEDFNFPRGKCNLVGVEGHIMHGVFHSNGFGHLLCINGVETGSELGGYQIMDLWDRLCTGLHARKVSLNDGSQKRGMDWRLLHCVAYGEPWFSRWGYRFGRGSYGVTKSMYHKAIEAIQAIPLCFLLHHLGPTNPDIVDIISKYQSTLSTSPSPHPQQHFSLTTLRDLVYFMLELRTHLPNDTETWGSDNQLSPHPATCRWSPKRVEMAARVIVEALRRAEFRWVSRQQVRDAARAYIGDTGLLDYVLKSLGNHVVGNFLVRRSLNPVTKVLEYCLVDISAFPGGAQFKASDGSRPKRHSITRAQLLKDLHRLSKSVLASRIQNPMLSGTVFAAIPVASRIILDTKLLVKEYDSNVAGGADGDNPPKIYCTVQLKTRDHVVDAEEKCRNSNNKQPPPALPPYECFVLKDDNATVDELKRQVEDRFSGTYLGLKGFHVNSLANVGTTTVKGSDPVLGLVASGSSVVLEGIGGEEMYEGGGDGEYRAVDCGCGAAGDDGERMICCDICEVWQHTRCVGFGDDEDIPHIFLCSRCEQDIVIFPTQP